MKKTEEKQVKKELLFLWGNLIAQVIMIIGFFFALFLLAKHVGLI
jgi:hypothetical protein